MIAKRLTHRILLAFACGLVLILAPLSVSAQTPGGVIKKGAQGVQKGVEGAAKGTEEGAEAVGKGVKKAVTGEDTTRSEGRMKGTQGTETRPSTTPSQTAPSDTTSKSTGTERTTTEKRLPRTAGELPLLALTGALALAAAGVSRVVRRAK